MAFRADTPPVSQPLPDPSVSTLRPLASILLLGGAEEVGDEPKGDGTKRKRRRRRRKGGADRGGEATTSAASTEGSSPESEDVQPEPPKATPDLLASLLTPSPRPRIGAAPKVAEAAVVEAPKPKRTPRAKVSSTPEPMAEAVAPAKRKAAPKAKAPAKAPVKKEKTEKTEKTAEAIPKVKATRAKKAKAE